MTDYSFLGVNLSFKASVLFDQMGVRTRQAVPVRFAGFTKKGINMVRSRYCDGVSMLQSLHSHCCSLRKLALPFTPIGGRNVTMALFIFDTK